MPPFPQPQSSTAGEGGTRYNERIAEILNYQPQPFAHAQEWMLAPSFSNRWNSEVAQPGDRHTRS